MTPSRRQFLAGTVAAAIGYTSSFARGELLESQDGSYSDQILELFEAVDGHKGIKIWAPAVADKPEFSVTLNHHDALFCGSSFKGFVLCEALRQQDSSDIDNILQSTQLALNESVWSPDSQSFNPPYLHGKVSERTALEAMIIHSDNTGADMILRHIGADSVRSFLKEAGLAHSYIPNSTRQFFGYLAGFSDWQGTTWEHINDFLNGGQPFVNPPLNNTQTMASSPDDFVSFYSRSLQGQFFRNAATLNEYRAILSRSDAIQQTIPLGASAFLKGGQIDVDPFHALCLAGGMYVVGRWVYFATMLNWNHPGSADPVTASAFIGAIAQAFELVKEAVG